MNAKQSAIRETLERDGWSIEVATVDAGGYGKDAVYFVTVRRNGQEFVTPYSKGCGLRRWRFSIALKQFNITKSYWGQWYMPGKRVPDWLLGKELDSSIVDEFAAATEPEPPTLDGVIWALNAEAKRVRHAETFAAFCLEFGYENDNREAEKTFTMCRGIQTGLLRLGADFDQLDALLQDF